MNKYLTDRDRKLLEIVVNKITDKQEQVKRLKYLTNEDTRKYIQLDSKDAGLSAAIGIISNMIWNENEDYFRDTVNMENKIKEFITEINNKFDNAKITYKYDEEEKLWFIFYNNKKFLHNIEFCKFIGILLKNKFYSQGMFDLCCTYNPEILCGN